jgi:hypothetical protein
MMIELGDKTFNSDAIDALVPPSPMLGTPAQVLMHSGDWFSLSISYEDARSILLTRPPSGD